MRPGTVKYLSTVVAMELLAGAHSDRDRRLVRRLVGRFRRVRRLAAPEEGSYLDAGDVLALLQTREGLQPKAATGLAQDVLLAAQAKRLGAILVTTNARHFRLIQRHFPCNLMLL